MVNASRRSKVNFIHYSSTCILITGQGSEAYFSCVGQDTPRIIARANRIELTYIKDRQHSLSNSLTMGNLDFPNSAIHASHRTVGGSWTTQTEPTVDDSKLQRSTLDKVCGVTDKHTISPQSIEVT